MSVSSEPLQYLGLWGLLQPGYCSAKMKNSHRRRHLGDKLSRKAAQTPFLIAEHQLLACLFLILCSLLRWFCLFKLGKSDHLSSPIYKLSIGPADPPTPYHTFKSKPGMFSPALSGCYIHLNAICIQYRSVVIWIMLA